MSGNEIKVYLHVYMCCFWQEWKKIMQKKCESEKLRHLSDTQFFSQEVGQERQEQAFHCTVNVNDFNTAAEQKRNEGSKDG